MAIPLILRSQHDLLYAYQLSASYRSPWVFDPDMALFQEPDIWEIIRNDAVVLSELERRNRNIVRPWRVIPNRHATRSKHLSKGVVDASKRMAGICYEALDGISEFNSARRRLADAFVLGRTYAYVSWEEKSLALDGTKRMTWFVPTRLTDIDRRRIHWVSEWVDTRQGHTKKKNVHLEMHDSERYGWFKISDDMRRSLVEYIYTDTEDRVGYGRGVMAALYFAHFCKTTGVKKLSEGIDRFANGVLKIKLDGLRHGSTTKTNDDLVAAAKAMVANYRSEHYMLMEETDDVEIMDAPGTALRFSLEAVRYWDEVIARLFNGSIRPSGHGSQKTGARAEAETQSDTSEQYYQDDRTHQDEITQRDVLQAFLYHNWHNIVALGLGEGKTPHFTSDQIKRQDALTELQINTESVKAGAPITKSEWYESINRTPPDEDDDVIEQEGMLESQQMNMTFQSGELDRESQMQMATQKTESDKRNGDPATKKSVEK